MRVIIEVLGGWVVGSVAIEESVTDDIHVRQFIDRYRRTFARSLQICNLATEEKWEWRPAETMSTTEEVFMSISG